MQTIKELHDKAMNLAEDAFHAQKSGREADAIRLFADALVLEQEAANSLPLSEESEPTRSILFRSAASLAFNSKNYELADRLIARGLSGFPTPEIMQELINLYEKERREGEEMKHPVSKIDAMLEAAFVEPKQAKSLSTKEFVAKMRTCSIPREDSITQWLARNLLEACTRLNTQQKDIERLKEALTRIRDGEPETCHRCNGNGRLWADGKAHYPSANLPTIACGNCGGSGRLQPENAQNIADQALEGENP